MHRRFILPTLFLLLLLSAASVQAESAPDPESNPQGQQVASRDDRRVIFTNETPVLSDAGHVTLHWSYSGDIPSPKFTLERATQQSFEDALVQYQGQNKGIFISGLPDGEFFFRIRVLEPNPSPWSAPITVQVKHHSLTLAFILFLIGAVVVSATVALIVHGYRNAGVATGHS